MNVSLVLVVFFFSVDTLKILGSSFRIVRLCFW